MIDVLVDTNILVSAILNNRRVFNRKFPDKIQAIEQFITSALPVVEVIPVPLSPYPDENEIRDVNDRPILRAAINVSADILLSGDKDFLESAVNHPKIMTAAQFLQAEGHR